MTLNCRPGDLARIVNAGSFTDKIIRVVAPEMYKGRPTWSYEGPHLLIPGTTYAIRAIYDHLLRPIRGLPGDDEMIKIAGKPPAVTNPRVLETTR